MARMSGCVEEGSGAGAANAAECGVDVCGRAAAWSVAVAPRRMQISLRRLRYLRLIGHPGGDEDSGSEDDIEQASRISRMSL